MLRLLFGFEGEDSSRVVHILSTLVLLGVLVIVSGLLLRSQQSGNVFAAVLEISGGVCQSAVSFTLPAIITLHATHNVSVFDRWKAWLLLLAGVLLPLTVAAIALTFI